jgi:NAD(P)-dependent dehydrogenase (short-subunit alcohol dehydrogenase family)
MTAAVNQCTFDFAGARVLVTGGTSGIGYAVAAAFAHAGADVTITGTRANPEAYAEPDLDLAGFTYRQLHAGDSAAIDTLAASFERLDVLVNNAGASMPFGVDEWTPEGFATSLDVNLKAAQRLSVGCHPALVNSELVGGASVVNVVSMAAFRAKPLVLGYSSAKAGLVALTQNLALQWMADGIRVNAIAPGLIRTRMTEPMSLFPEIEAAEMARVPSPRQGKPEECAAAALFLCTAASAYTTGISLAVDGGYLAF